MGVMPEEMTPGSAFMYGVWRTVSGGLPKYYDKEKALAVEKKRVSEVAKAVTDGWSYEVNNKLRVAKDRITGRSELIRKNRATVVAWNEFLDGLYPRTGKGQRGAGVLTPELEELRQTTREAAEGNSQLTALLDILELEARKAGVDYFRASLRDAMLKDAEASIDHMFRANDHPLIEPPQQ